MVESFRLLLETVFARFFMFGHMGCGGSAHAKPTTVVRQLGLLGTDCIGELND
jgi:hypothetical protein